MSLLRYLGIVVGDAGELASLPVQPGLGRFVPVGEPLPVGTVVDVDGVSHRVTRVDEGVVPGCWLHAEGAAAQPADDVPTLREIVSPPEQHTPAVLGPAAIAAPAASVSPPEPNRPEPGTPEPVPSEITADSGGKKRGKRRGGKTIIGR